MAKHSSITCIYMQMSCRIRTVIKEVFIVVLCDPEEAWPVHVVGKVEKYVSKKFPSH